MSGSILTSRVKGGTGAALHGTTGRQIAERNDLVLADIYAAEVGVDWIVDEDHCHPNDLGHLLVANDPWDGVAVSGLRQKPPDLGKMAYHHPDGDLAWKIAEGRGAMPGWRETLSDEDIWDLVNFIRSLGR